MGIPVRRHIKTVTGLGALAGSIVAVMMSAASATAAPSCYGDYCSGRSPISTGCKAGAREETWSRFTYYYVFGVSHKTGYLGYLSLWWSQACGTHWAQWIATNSDDPSYDIGPLQTWQQNGYHVTWSRDFSSRNIRYIGQMVYSRTNCAYAVFGTQFGTVRTACILN